MGRYIVKRVLQFIPVFLGVTLILFLMENVVPGDPIKLIAGEKKLDPQTEINLRIKYHLIESDSNGKPIYDENGNTIETPMWERYVDYVGGLLHGDLGYSYQQNGRPVADILAEKYPYTIKLAVVAIILEAIIGIGAGMISAIKRYSFWDILVTSSPPSTCPSPRSGWACCSSCSLASCSRTPPAGRSTCQSRVRATHRRV